MKKNRYFSAIVITALLLLIILAQINGQQSREADPVTDNVAVETQNARQPSVPALSNHSVPDEARQTFSLIFEGGPFPYRQDGGVFHNREKKLPAQSKNYYREYTVKTPNVADRGARRIVCGGEMPKRPDICYYTQDHYRTFTPIYHETSAAQ